MSDDRPWYREPETFIAVATDNYLGGTSTWEIAEKCPAQPAGFDL